MVDVSETLTGIGAALGAASFSWQILAYRQGRRQRQWADDLREVLVPIQDAVTTLRGSACNAEWTRKHVVPLTEQLRSVEARMPGSVTSRLRGKVGVLGDCLRRCHFHAEDPIYQASRADVARSAATQQQASSEALRLTLWLLKKI